MRVSVGLLPWLTEDHNDMEREIDKLESSWADFLYGARTGSRVRRNDDAGQSLGTTSLRDVRIQLDVYRNRFESGSDPLALLYALKFAIEEVVPVPYWVANQVIARIGRVTGLQSAEPISLHDAFELNGPLPLSRKHWAAARRDFRYQQLLYRDVSTLIHQEQLSLNAALKRALKQGDYPLGMTRARELYVAQERIQQMHLLKRPRKRPKQPTK